MLRESHCKRNQSCTGEQKHGKERNLKNLGHIHIIFARMQITCECERDMRTRHANFFANPSEVSYHSRYILRAFNFL